MGRNRHQTARTNTIVGALIVTVFLMTSMYLMMLAPSLANDRTAPILFPGSHHRNVVEDHSPPVNPDPNPNPNNGKLPFTIPQTVTFFNSYIQKLHQILIDNKKSSTPMVWSAFHDLTSSTVLEWDREYRTRMPPRRTDDSIFMSVASYRDENCFPTLRDAYGQAERPEKLFVGLVQQNCHEGCRSGVLEGGKVSLEFWSWGWS